MLKLLKTENRLTFQHFVKRSSKILKVGQTVDTVNEKDDFNISTATTTTTILFIFLDKKSFDFFDF